MSNSFPNTLSSLRNHRDKAATKTQVHAHNSFVKLKVYSKRYSFGELLKTLHTLKKQSHNENRLSPDTSIDILTHLNRTCTVRALGRCQIVLFVSISASLPTMDAFCLHFHIADHG